MCQRTNYKLTHTFAQQVKVTVRQSSVAVAVAGVAGVGVGGAGSSWHTLLEGTLPHPVKAEECLWSLVSAEHVAVSCVLSSLKNIRTLATSGIFFLCVFVVLWPVPF